MVTSVHRSLAAPYIQERILEMVDDTRGPKRGPTRYSPELFRVGLLWPRERDRLLELAAFAGVELSSALVTGPHVLETMRDEAAKYGLEVRALEAVPDDVTVARPCVLVYHAGEQVGLLCSARTWPERPEAGNQRLQALRTRVKWLSASVLTIADAQIAKRGIAA